MDSYPLIRCQPGDSILGWDDGKHVSVDQFLADTFSLSQILQMLLGYLIYVITGTVFL